MTSINPTVLSSGAVVAENALKAQVNGGAKGIRTPAIPGETGLDLRRKQSVNISRDSRVPAEMQIGAVHDSTDSSPADGREHYPLHMGDGEDYDSAMAGEPTELAPSADETAAHTAWALDDGPEWKPPFWTPGRITAAVAGVAVVVAVGAAGVVGYHLRSEPGGTSPMAAGPPPSTGATTPPMPPPPATVTVMPPSTVTVTKPAPAAEDVALPPGKVPFESPDPRDPQFVENMRAQGWSVADDRVVATWAHRVCGALQDGATPSAAVEHLLSEAGLSVPYPQREIDKARQFVATVISTYPQCY